jgi:hypothetical protein
MNLFEIFKNTLEEEKLPYIANTRFKKRGILLLDVDDTLLKASNIFIHRRLPTDEKDVLLTPAQFAKEKVTPETEQFYSFKEFRNREKIINSIVNGLPYLKNIKVMNSFVEGGYKIGILTARGMESAVYTSIKAFFNNLYKEGKLNKVPNLERKYTFAVGDDYKKYQGRTSAERKQKIISIIKDKFDYVYLMDDDLKNIKAVLEYKNTIKNPEERKKIRTITANKEDLEESFLQEMAVKDFEDKEFVDLIEKGDLKKAGVYYIEKTIRNNPKKYVGLSWKEAASKINSYGIGKSLKVALRDGAITNDFAEKVEKSIRLAYSENKDDIKNDSSEDAEAVPVSGLGKIKEFIEKVEKEKNKLETYHLKEMREILTKDEDDLTPRNKSQEDEYTKWVYLEIIPNKIKDDKLGDFEKRRLEREVKGSVTKETIENVYKLLKSYHSFLNKVILTYKIFAEGPETDEEKESNLKSDEKFMKLVSDVKEIFKEKSKKAEEKRIEREKKVSKGFVSDGIYDIAKEYYEEIKKIEEAYKNDKLRDYLSINYKKIRSMISKTRDGINRSDLKEEESFTEKFEFGEEVKSIIEKRSKMKPSFPTKEEDAKELAYLYDFKEEGKGSEKKVFELLINIYLDYIDGLSFIYKARNSGKNVTDETKKRHEVIERRKKEKEELERNSNTGFSVDVFEKLIEDLLEKEKNEIVKNKVDFILSSLDFKETKENLGALAKTYKDDGLIKFLEDFKKHVDKIPMEKQKEFLKNVFKNLSSEQRFAHRVAITINFLGNRLAEEEISQLVKKALEGSDYSALFEELKKEQFSIKK